MTSLILLALLLAVYMAFWSWAAWQVVSHGEPGSIVRWWRRRRLRKLYPRLSNAGATDVIAVWRKRTKAA